jgi:hypothetical protein
LLSDASPVDESVAAVVASVFPDAARAAAADAPPAGEEPAEKKDAWEKQLLEHSLFRVLGACAFALISLAASARIPADAALAQTR